MVLESAFLLLLFFYYVHITSSKRIRKDNVNGTETRTNVTTNEQALHRDAAVMVGH